MCCICRNSACYREHSFVFWAVTMVLSRPAALSCIPTTNVLGSDIFTLSDARVCLHRRHPDRGKGTAYCRFDMDIPVLQHNALYFMVTTCFFLFFGKMSIHVFALIFFLTAWVLYILWLLSNVWFENICPFMGCPHSMDSVFQCAAG